VTDTAALRDLCVDLARALADRVRPELGAAAARRHGQVGAGGDVTFSIDEGAEAELARFLRERAPHLAWYSEDQGLISPPGADTVLIVDPIDGTRPAIAGFEAACVSVAAAPLGDGNPRMGDVTVGVIVEIKTGREYVAVRGEGLRSTDPVRLSPETDLSRLFWTFGFRGRPARELVTVLGDLIDRSSVGGGVFDLGSACFDSVCVLTGQLDAFLEPGPRMIDEVPGTRAAFERVGDGAVLNNAPYDLAAAVLCLREGGAVVTDCAGRTLADRPLLGSGHDFQMSILASANAELHDALVAEMDRGIARLRASVAVG
jgi:myo-inositol-1(or 4)-monophosphatase